MLRIMDVFKWELKGIRQENTIIPNLECCITVYKGWRSPHQTFNNTTRLIIIKLSCFAGSPLKDDAKQKINTTETQKCSVSWL